MNGYDNIGSEIIQERQHTIAKSVMIRTYAYMFGVTILSGIMACIGFSSGYYEVLLTSSVWWIMFAIELLAVFLCSRAAESGNGALAGTMLVVYSIVNGLTLSYIFVMFDLSSILFIFFIAAGMFGGLALYGTFTKKDLTTVGTIGIMSLFGVILLSVVNIFLRSEGLDLGLSILTLALFVGITAYDGQEIKRLAYQADERTVNTFAIMGALTLYLDFINIFLNLLELFGRDD